MTTKNKYRNYTGDLDHLIWIFKKIKLFLKNDVRSPRKTKNPTKNYLYLFEIIGNANTFFAIILCQIYIYFFGILICCIK